MHDHVINQIAFTAEDLQLIKDTAFAQWPEDGFTKHEAFDAWLETTPINPTLRPHLWGLIGAHYPNRFFANWDLVGVFDCLQIRPGLILETRWGRQDTKLTPTNITDALEAISDRVNVELLISRAIFVLITNDDTDALEHLWVCADVAERLLLGSTVSWNQTRITVSGPTAENLCVWLTACAGTGKSSL